MTDSIASLPSDTLTDAVFKPPVTVRVICPDAGTTGKRAGRAAAMKTARRFTLGALSVDGEFDPVVDGREPLPVYVDIFVEQHAEFEPAAGNDVQGGRILGYAHRVVQG